MTHIAQLFFHFDHFLGATPIGNGHINDTYRVDYQAGAAHKTALLQRLNHEVFQQPELVMENTLRICQHLERKDYPYQVASPLPALDGTFLQKDQEGNYWRAFPFIENSFAPDGISDAGTAYEAARAYGAFARALQDYPAHTLAETIPGFHDTDRRWQYFLSILKIDPVHRAKGTEAEIEAIFAAKPVFDQISQLKKSGALPLRVSHNDTKAGNILFDLNTRKALAVIDLDTVMPGTVLSDFGDMVRTFASDCPEDSLATPVLNKKVLDALTSGYLKETEKILTQLEKENLMMGAAWITGEQTLRFLTDWLAGDVYYKITSPEQNLVRARNQLALFRCMMYEL
ncbi:MAG: phosphotransferase enzyme family protein [Saprospiraceae bacterium]